MAAIDRRGVLYGAAGVGLAAAVGDLGFLAALPRAAAADGGRVPLRPEVEPLARLLEETPRERLMEALAAEVRRGVGYQQILAALMLAGVRNIRPHPVGFKFHAVLVVNSAHLASLASPDRDRWLPVFWAADQFKSSQAQDVSQGDWVLPALRDSDLPSAAEARDRFIRAMDRWDEAAADASVARLARVSGAAELWELFWRYGARDFRDIGHKAIYAANAWRTLHAIGWEHAEPVCRSLAMAMLDRGGTRGNPADMDEPEDRPWRSNLARVKRIRPDWKLGSDDPGAARALLTSLRTAGPEEASEEVVRLVNGGASTRCLWDGVLTAAGELIGRQPGIVGIHCVTTANALRFGAQISGSDETRLMLLLQGAAFMAMFRQAMGRRGAVGELALDRLEPAEGVPSGPAGIEAVFDSVGRDRLLAARRTLAYLKGGGSAEELMTAGRRLIFLKGTNSHDYKFSSAALEDYAHVGSGLAEPFLASSMFNLRGSTERDNPLTARIRAALG